MGVVSGAKVWRRLCWFVIVFGLVVEGVVFIGVYGGVGFPIIMYLAIESVIMLMSPAAGAIIIRSIVLIVDMIKMDMRIALKIVYGQSSVTIKLANAEGIINEPRSLAFLELSR